MNKRNQKNMDKKKTKRRKSNAGKRHGRAEPEEKPKSTEVMNEKEKQERLEAASVLSSLMFFPPKSSEDQDNSERVDKNDLVTPSTSMTQFSAQASTSGIPITSQLTSLVQGSGRGSPASARQTENATNIKNSIILAQLQNQFNLALKNRNVQVQPIFHSQAPVLNMRTPNKNITPTYVTNDKSDSKNVPLTVLKQNLTVNKDVAKALRQVVSNNKIKAETPSTEPIQKQAVTNSDTKAASVSAQEDKHEKMEYESLLSSRKLGGSETNLPLKKRRLIGMSADSLTTSDLNLNSAFSANLDTLSSARQLENILQMAKDYPVTTPETAMSLVSNLSQPRKQSGEGYRPVLFDPRTSLMVLSDLKFALTPDEDGDLPIHIAVVHENTELVRKFIDIMAVSGKTVDRFNKLQQTPLHLAVLVNKPEIINVLLAAGANPNLLDRHGYTCLHISVNKQQHSCMETLFSTSKYPVSLNTRDYEGYYPLHTCVELDNLDLMVELIQHGADKDCQDGKAGRSVLLYAVEYNRSDMVQYLLTIGATPDLQNYASVTPLMTAQAATMNDIVGHLTKALDFGNKYEDSYIPTKKVSTPKIPSKSAQIVTKDIRTGKMSGAMPLIYEEYEPGMRSHSLPDGYKKEPVSRQSSVSSPIDLSMRHEPDIAQNPPEMTIRGKPGRRKNKKEHKNHKEKQPQKSMLKERHASVVAALERSIFADKNYQMKANGKSPESGYKMVEPHIKVEPTDSEEIEMRSKERTDEVVDVETVRTKASSEALSSFILNLKPDQTKYLVEKVKQQLSVTRSDNSHLIHGSPKKYSTKSPFDKKTDHIEKLSETNSEQDIEENGVLVTEDASATDLRGRSEALTIKSQVFVRKENEENVKDSESTKMDTDTEVISKETDDSPVTAVQTQSSSQSPEVEDGNESDIKDNENDIVEQPVEVTIETNETCSAPVSHDDPNSPSDESDNDGSNEGKVFESSVKKFKHLSNNSELTSHISQESASSTSLRGSQESQGFELISSPRLNSKEKVESNHTLLEHSEDSMEVEYTDNTSDTKIVQQSETEMDIVASDAGFKEKLYNYVATDGDDKDNNTVDVNKEETRLKDSMDTDEDDEESGLVIDEHVSEEDTLSNYDKAASLKAGSSNDNIVDVEKDRNANQLTEVQHAGNDELQGRVENNDLESNVNDRTRVNSHKENVKNVDKVSFDNGMENELIGSAVSSDVSVLDKESSKMEQITLETKGQENITNSGTTQGLNQNISSEELLTKGHAQTFYFHDGDSFKPVKIFIDNSEQSSLVLQRMFQTAQLTNVNKQSGSIAPTDLKISPQSAFSEIRKSVSISSTSSNITPSQSVTSSGNSSVQNELTTKGIEKNNDKADLHSSNLNVKTVSVTSIRPSVLAPNTSAAEQSFQQAYIESLKPTENREAIDSNSVSKQTKQQTFPNSKESSDHTVKKNISQNAKQKLPVVQKTSKSFDSLTSTSYANERNQRGDAQIATFLPSRKLHGAFPIGKFTSEGTLTRVNPDVRSRLSKALQSPQRRVGLVRSDSDSYTVNNRGVLGNVVSSVPGTTNTSVTDSRQQL